MANMMSSFESSWNSLVNMWTTYGELPLSYRWVIFLTTLLAGFFLQKAAAFVIRKLKSRNLMISKAPPYLQQLGQSQIEKPLALLIACGVWYIAAFLVPAQGLAHGILVSGVKLLFFIGLIWAALIAIDALGHFIDELVSKTDNTIDDLVAPLMTKSLKVFAIVFGALLTLQNLGINVLSLLAGLGLGGLALALAAKDTAANLFGSITIILDRPFKIGDWIRIGDFEGTVEEIGFRSTRIRTFYKSLVSVPNSFIASERVDNMGMRPFRRTSATLGLTYDTSPEKMELFCEGAKKIIQASAKTVDDPVYVFFSGYGNSALEVMLYFFHDVSSWAEELEERQNIYLQLLHLARELGVSFAFPTQTLHIESLPSTESQSRPHQIQPDLTNLREVAHAFGAAGQHSRPEGYGFYTPKHRETT